MEQAIDKTAASYEELQKYLKKDGDKFAQDAEGNYIIQEGMEQEYLAAKNALVLQLIEDYTAFDDYIYLYADLVKFFENQSDIDLAADFLDAFDINKVQEVDSAFYYELRRFIEKDAERAQAIIEQY